MIDNTENRMTTTATRRARPTIREMPRLWACNPSESSGIVVRETFLLHMKIRQRKCTLLNLFSDRNMYDAKLDP
jgi:hypothetical protein